MTHPFVIDTSIIFPHPHGPPLKLSLKSLTLKYLCRAIQKGHGSVGHDSIEDAKACLDLLKEKCMKGAAWGLGDSENESVFARLGRSSRFNSKHVGALNRTGAMVDWGQPERGIGSPAEVCIGCENDEEVVQGAIDAINGDPEGKIVAGGGVDFLFARFRELEALRGWWNGNRGEGDAAHSAKAVFEAKEGEGRLPDEGKELDEERLFDAVQRTVGRITKVWETLPPCTVFIVYSGSGDPREMSRMKAMHHQFREEYRTKKWDELTVKWTDGEQQELRKAVEKAKAGICFIAVK